MFLRFCTIAAALLVLTACSSQDYAPEQAEELVEAPTSWRHATVAAEPAERVCRNLGGPSLAELERRLVSGNLELRAAVARLRQAEAIARGGRSPLLPRLDLAISASRGTAVTTFGAGGLPAGGAGFFPTGDVSERYQGSLAASYEVDVWGRVRNEYRAASLQAKAAEETLAAVEVSLSAQLADTWSALLAQRELVALLEAQVQTSRRFLELTRLRFSLGQTPAADVGRQRQQLQQRSGQLSVAQGQLVVLEDQLAALLGAAPEQLSLPPGDVLPAMPGLPDPGVPAALPEVRPDVRAARLALAAADRQLAAAIAARLPTLSLNASLLSIETLLEDLFRDTLWQVGAEVTTNVFDFGQRRANIDLQDAQAEEALLDYAATLLRAWTEVSTTLAQTEARNALVRSLELQLQDAARVLTLTRDAYREGQADFLDVLVALQSKQGLEQRLVEARRNQYSDRIQLCRALGISLVAAEAGES